MVGNDVIDLADAEAPSTPRHPRFDARVFAACELRSLAAADPEAPLRWVLWAAKEAAYKLARRRTSTTVFSPARFVVELDPQLEGCVRHGDDAYPVRVTVNGECVHAVVTEPGGSFDRIAAGAQQRENTEEPRSQSRAVRAFAIAELAPQLGTDADSLSIHSRERIPQLHRSSSAAADLSLSHHGRFVAYACALPRPHAGNLR